MDFTSNEATETPATSKQHSITPGTKDQQSKENKSTTMDKQHTGQYKETSSSNVIKREWNSNIKSLLFTNLIISL